MYERQCIYHTIPLQRVNLRDLRGLLIDLFSSLHKYLKVLVVYLT